MMSEKKRKLFIRVVAIVMSVLMLGSALSAILFLT